MKDLDWQDLAACRGYDQDWWFRPGVADRPGDPPQSDPYEEAARCVCASCPVRETCLTFGLKEKWGIWGGMDREERRLERIRRTAKARKARKAS